MRTSIIAVLVLTSCAFKPYCTPHIICPLNHQRGHGACNLSLDCGIKVEKASDN